MQLEQFENENPSLLMSVLDKLQIIYRNKIDRYTFSLPTYHRYIIYKKWRWCFFLLTLVIYLARILSIGGYFLITYTLGLYYLHLLIKFCTPLGVPDIDEEEDDFNESNYTQFYLILV